jgi:site-specific DNA-methyltransferase (cytosine-N4-specific)
MTLMKLTWHPYRYYPYERQLALREVTTLLGSTRVREIANGIELAGGTTEEARRLVYFSQIHDGRLAIDTIQARLERVTMATRNRQATRYSTHGLHEYKGKFNPQVAKAILNIFGVRAGDQVLDPFCGSGTTLVECAQMGAHGFGFDINPFAVFLANAKLQALTTPAEVISDVLVRLRNSFGRTKQWDATVVYDDRGIYLRSWFDTTILSIIEVIRGRIEKIAGEHAPIFLAIASNLLRDYSLQDPNDLRIRRRNSPLPETSFVDAFIVAAQNFVKQVADAQNILGVGLPASAAMHCSINSLSEPNHLSLFDAALTSPPYAMALPYIDTQRLSLVWLGLISPKDILRLEANLIGSRELRGTAGRDLASRLSENREKLPQEQALFCQYLQSYIGKADGFRRKAVPVLLYRYFGDMLASFRAVRKKMKPGAPYALIVGHNHTVLGGVRHDIDTPRHLAALAKFSGWKVEELIDLQTYQRYGYHAGNAVSAETLILLRNT